MGCHARVPRLLALDHKGVQFYPFQLEDMDALFCYFLSLPPCVRIRYLRALCLPEGFVECRASGVEGPVLRTTWPNMQAAADLLPLLTPFGCRAWKCERTSWKGCVMTFKTVEGRELLTWQAWLMVFCYHKAPAHQCTLDTILERPCWYESLPFNYERLFFSQEHPLLAEMHQALTTPKESGFEEEAGPGL